MQSLCVAAFVVIGCLVVNIHCVPVESVTNEPEEQQPPQQIAVPLPAILEMDEKAENPSESLVVLVPISLLDVEPVAEQPSTDESAQRTARGLGGFGGLGKFGGLGLGFKGGFGFGGFGGLHGLGGGLHGFGGGFKPFFGKHFG